MPTHLHNYVLNLIVTLFSFLLGGMFSWVTSTLVQGEFGRKQTCQCSPAQSAQSVGGIALRYEIGCKPFTSLSGPYSASCPKVKILIHFSLEGQNYFVLFSFNFQILGIKPHTLFFNHFWISCFINQISIKAKIFNMFYLISK